MLFTGPEIVSILEQLGVTDVVWIPDSTLGTWEAALEASSQIRLVRVCREGEAWPLAAGLYLGGRRPLVVMQTTGLFESGDALRNVIHDLQLPLLAIVGARNWLIGGSTDSAKRFAEPILNSWQVSYLIIEDSEHKDRLAGHYQTCQAAGVAGIVLLAEGAG